MHHVTEYSTAKTKEYPSDIAQFSKEQMLLKIINTIAPICLKNMFRYNMLLDISVPQKLKVFLKLRFLKTDCFLEHIMSKGKYLSLFLLLPYVPVGIIGRE